MEISNLGFLLLVMLKKKGLIWVLLKWTVCQKCFRGLIDPENYLRDSCLFHNLVEQEGLWFHISISHSHLCLSDSMLPFSRKYV